MNERRILRLPEVVKLVGYRRTSIYSFMKQGSFPKRHTTWGRERWAGILRMFKTGSTPNSRARALKLRISNKRR